LSGAHSLASSAAIPLEQQAASSALADDPNTSSLPSLIVLHHLCVDLLAYLTAQMVVWSGQFQPKALINCIELLKQILKVWLKESLVLFCFWKVFFGIHCHFIYSDVVSLAFL
jgi:hypothetical protein